MEARLGTGVVAFVALASAAPSQVSAQAGTVPTVNAVRLAADHAEKIRIDGILDERAWRDVSAATDFRQQEPLEGAAATERTEVRVLFDETTLYIGVLEGETFLPTAAARAFVPLGEVSIMPRQRPLWTVAPANSVVE